MMTMLAIVMTTLYRSTQGAIMAKNLKNSNQAYQLSDGIAETALQNIQRVDNGTIITVGTLTLTNKIPEAISAYNFCEQSGQVTCFKLSAAQQPVKITSTDTAKLNEVVQIGVAQTDASGVTARAVQVSVPPRIPLPVVNNFTAAVVVAPNVTASWTNPTASSQGDMFQVRRAALTTATQKEKTGRDLLEDDSLDWTVVSAGTIVWASTTGNKSVTDLDVPAGTYAYTLKVTNKDALKLDSSYILPVKITK